MIALNTIIQKLHSNKQLSYFFLMNRLGYKNNCYFC